LTDSGFEGSECEGGLGLDAFPDDGDGIARETSIEDSQEPVADQGPIGRQGAVSQSWTVTDLRIGHCPLKLRDEIF